MPITRKCIHLSNDEKVMLTKAVTNVIDGCLIGTDSDMYDIYRHIIAKLDALTIKPARIPGHIEEHYSLDIVGGEYDSCLFALSSFADNTDMLQTKIRNAPNVSEKYI